MWHNHTDTSMLRLSGRSSYWRPSTPLTSLGCRRVSSRLVALSTPGRAIMSHRYSTRSSSLKDWNGCLADNNHVEAHPGLRYGLPAHSLSRFILPQEWIGFRGVNNQHGNWTGEEVIMSPRRLRRYTSRRDYSGFLLVNNRPADFTPISSGTISARSSTLFTSPKICNGCQVGRFRGDRFLPATFRTSLSIRFPYLGQPLILPRWSGSPVVNSQLERSLGKIFVHSACSLSLSTILERWHGFLSGTIQDGPSLQAASPSSPSIHSLDQRLCLILPRWSGCLKERSYRDVRCHPGILRYTSLILCRYLLRPLPSLSSRGCGGGEGHIKWL